MEEKQIQLVVMDLQGQFLHQMEEEILRRYADHVTIQLITEETFAQEYFQEPRQIDVLILDADSYPAVPQEQKVPHTLLLAGEVASEEAYPESVEVLIQAMPLGEIFRRIDLALQDRGAVVGEIPEEETHTTRVIAVYSPIGGSGKSLVAYSLAKKLKKLDQKVLLVGCDPTQSISVYYPPDVFAKEELADKLIHPDDATYWTILQNVGQDDISFLLSFEKNLSTLELGMQQWDLMLTVLTEKQDFDYIILDVGTVLDRETASVLAKANFLILLTETNQIANRKMQKLLQDSELLPKCECFLVANEYRSDGMRMAAESIFGAISAYPTWEEAVEDPVFYQIALKVTE